MATLEQMYEDEVMLREKLEVKITRLRDDYIRLREQMEQVMGYANANKGAVNERNQFRAENARLRVVINDVEWLLEEGTPFHPNLADEWFRRRDAVRQTLQESEER